MDADPANYSAHLFLGDSYQAQRDLKESTSDSRRRR
jgi:hypothetical protein